MSKVTVKAGEVEKGVPIPPVPVGRKKGSGLASVIASLEVGESTLLATRIPKNARSVVAYTQRQLRGERKFTTRTVEGGVRVWRVE